MQNARFGMVNYEGKLVQTRNFGNKKKFFENNMKATSSLLAPLEKKDGYFWGWEKIELSFVFRSEG